MRRLTMLRWLGSGAMLGLGLVVGCSHNRPTTLQHATAIPVACANGNCGNCANGACANGNCGNCANGNCANANCAGCARNVPMYTSGDSVPAPSYGAMPAPRPSSPATTVELRQTPDRGPEVQPSGLKSPFTRGEPLPTRKSYVDITAAPCFNHAPDYSSINGQLEQVRATNTWKLRYLSVDESDIHGGSVTLTGDAAQLSTFQDGQYVKIQGHLLNPDQKGIAPAYRVESVEPVSNSN